jgi:hypothetical protein
VLQQPLPSVLLPSVDPDTSEPIGLSRGQTLLGCIFDAATGSFHNGGLAALASYETAIKIKETCPRFADQEKAINETCPRFAVQGKSNRGNLSALSREMKGNQ